MQHGGAVALQHHLNTAEQKAKHTRVTIDKFPDERSDQNDWIQRVELAFKESLQLKFLKDRTTCSKDPAISEQHCATLLLTFSNSVHRPTVEAFSSDNAFDFWESVNNTFCDAINKNDEQMVAWMEIFGLSCTNASKFSSKFSTKTDYNGNYGTQSIHLSDDSRIPLDYDGFKVYLDKSRPTDDDMIRYPQVVLTSESTYTPQTRKYSPRVEPQKLTLPDCQAHLGYCTEEVPWKTLEGTTRLVPTVETETRDYPHGHKKTCLPMLHPFRIDDAATLDIFHSTLPSAHGYRKFLMCSLIFSKLDNVHLMRAEN
ncbi:predicted protein [Chaetoceros tenuissimus]|uniref:Uncharacterized protein n=1 Tax=Chaetoceros tenuissimus TaxID=426638 RepID=A0AAD3HDS8_9STRA|nr:predicted protein [Chaetoceros tenuissimus]